MGVYGFLRPTKRKLLLLIIFISIASLLFYFFTKPRQENLEVTTVKRQDIKATVSAAGVLTGKSSADLRFKASGKMTFINIKTGDNVFAGQVIAGQDTQDLAISLQQAQNTLRDKQATVDKTLDDIHLFQYGNGGFPNVGSPNETMTQRQLRTTAEVARDNAFDGVKLGQRSFQDALIISPIEGTVTEALEVPGRIVTSADIIARVVDLSAIYFDAEVDEADIGLVSVGQDAEISLNSYSDKTYTGKVAQIIPSTKTTASNATVVIVRITLNSTDIMIIPGLNGHAVITVGKASNVLTVPTESIKSDSTVLVKEGSKFKSIKVTTGLVSDTDTEVKSGLSEGQQIILNPSES